MLRTLGREQRPHAQACGLFFSPPARPLAVVLALLLAACAPTTTPPRGEAAAAPAPRSAVRVRHPNILLIVADDMGQADLGSFGGEIATPSLDRLAYAGVRFTDFHAAPACSPSRAMLLTGADSHLTGLGNLAEELAPNQKGQAGYEGALNGHVVTLAQRLKDAGYHTFMTGKWHLGATPASVPAARGFDRSFLLASGGASHFADMQPAYAPTPQSRANYWEDGHRLDALPPTFHYSSQFYVDRLIEYLDADRTAAVGARRSSPTSPSPRRTGRCRRRTRPSPARPAATTPGYDALAEQRLARQKQLGIVPPSARSPAGRRVAAPGTRSAPPSGARRYVAWRCTRR
ncbi:MAG: sulfatase-like hydrolase/transferase [Steroidobacteraceae bacterium]